MKKIAKITLILSVYLVWVFGNSVIALSCRANHEEHIHCCSKHCDCHHEGWELAHFESPHGCHHDHSNKIVLYDTTKEDSNNIEPAEINITAILKENISIEDIVAVRSDRYYERKIPLPPSPTLLGCGLRAPPVIA